MTGPPLIVIQREAKKPKSDSASAGVFAIDSCLIAWSFYHDALKQGIRAPVNRLQSE